jgi:hypothetical protein
VSSLLLFVFSCSVSFFTSLSLYQGKKKLASLCCLPPRLHTFSSLTISTVLCSYPISPSSPVLFNFLLHTCHRSSVRSSTYKCICLTKTPRQHDLFLCSVLVIIFLPVLTKTMGLTSDRLVKIPTIFHSRIRSPGNRKCIDTLNPYYNDISHSEPKFSY